MAIKQGLKSVGRKGLIGLLGVAGLVNVGCSSGLNSYISFRAEPCVEFDAKMNAALSYYTQNQDKYKSEPFLFEGIILKGNINNSRYIKNAYITNERGDILYTFIKDRKDQEDMKSYITWVHAAPRDFENPKEDAYVDEFFEIKNPIFAQRYIFVAEFNNGKIVKNDHTYRDEIKHLEKIEKEYRKELEKKK